MTLKSDATFKEKFTGDLKNDIKNLPNFEPILKTLKMCTLIKVYNV